MKISPEPMIAIDPLSGVASEIFAKDGSGVIPEASIGSMHKNRKTVIKAFTLSIPFVIIEADG
jgi:hypothetical protein